MVKEVGRSEKNIRMNEKKRQILSALYSSVELKFWALKGNFL